MIEVNPIVAEPIKSKKHVGVIDNAYADVDATHKASEVVAAIREDILARLKRRRPERFGPIDEALMLFDDIVAMAQRQIARGRDH